ncbi:YhbD family protein [Brevibacillus panacihumi]|uniref:YhbD family protein n=1 Tax=Brevibacillus panacihumi TaxID=497735 RepID=UPI003D088A11
MERELISKKELLELTGISYGQLYRWKRKRLIPEEWFIRKSTFTGQETFFPKELILGRIDQIINKKDDLSLDELAEKLSQSPLLPDMHATAGELLERNIVSKVVLDRYGITHGSERGAVYSFPEFFPLFVIDQLLAAGEISLEEGGLLVETLNEQWQKLEGKPCDLLFFRKMGLSTCVIVSVPAELHFDKGVKVVARLSLLDLTEQVKGKLI